MIKNKLKGLLVMAGLIIAGNASATTPFKCLYVAGHVAPTGAGTVYLNAKNDDEGKWVKDKSAAAGEEVFIKYIPGENGGTEAPAPIGWNKGIGVYELKVDVTAASGYELVCYANNLNEDGLYGADDVYAVIKNDENRGLSTGRTWEFNWTGEDDWVNANVPDAVHQVDGNSSGEINGNRETLFDMDALFHSTPDAHVYAIFRKTGEEFPKFDETFEGHLYNLVGVEALAGSEWNLYDASNTFMLKDLSDKNVWTLTKENVSLTTGKYEYKVVKSHDYSVGQWPSEGNFTLDIARDGNYNVTFTFDLNTNTCTATAERIVKYKTVSETFINGNNWENVYAYAWAKTDDTQKPLGDWPGMKLDGSAPVKAGNKWLGGYEVHASLEEGVEYGLIFNNGEGVQTADLTFADNKIFVDGDALAVNIIDWNGEMGSGINVEGATWVADNNVTVYGGTHVAKTFAFKGEMDQLPEEVTFATGNAGVNGTAKFLTGEYLAYDGGTASTKFVIADAIAPLDLNDVAEVGAKVCYDRHFTVDKMATVSLPFNMSPEEIAAAGEFYALDSYADGVITFKTATTVEANVPYVFIPAMEYPFENLADQGFVGVRESAVDKDGAVFHNYAAATAIAGVYGIKDGEFVKVNSGTYNPYRAVVELIDDAPAKLAIDLGTTGISEMSSEEMISAPIFDLQGRRIQTISKGLYIQNGKKFIVK